MSPPTLGSPDDLLLIRPQHDGEPPGEAQALPRLAPSSPLLVIDPVPSGALPLPQEADPIPLVASGALLSLVPLPPTANPPAESEVFPPLSASRPMLVATDVARGGPLPVLSPGADPQVEEEARRALHQRLTAAAIEALHQLGAREAPAIEALRAGRVLWQGDDRLITLVSAWHALRQPELPPETAARALTLLILYITHTLGRPLSLTVGALAAVRQALPQMHQPLPQLLRLMSGVETRLNPAPPIQAPPREQPRSRAQVAQGPAAPRPDLYRLISIGVAASLLLGLAGYWAMAALPRSRPLDPATLSDLLPVRQARVAEGTVELTLSDEGFGALPPQAQQEVVQRLMTRLEQGRGAKKIHMGVLRTPGQDFFFQSGVGERLMITPQPRSRGEDRAR